MDSLLLRDSRNWTTSPWHCLVLFSSNKCTIDPWRCGTLNACRVDAVFPEIMRLAVVCAESNRCSVQLEENLFANSLFPIWYWSSSFVYKTCYILRRSVWICGTVLPRTRTPCNKKQCCSRCCRNKDFKLVVWPLQTEAHLISAQIFFFAATRLDYDEDGNWSLNSTRKIHHETSLVDGASLELDMKAWDIT